MVVADDKEVPPGFVVDFIVELMQIADLERGCFGWLVIESHHPSVSFKIRFLVGEEDFITYADLKGLVIIFFLTKWIRKPKPIPEPIAVAIAREPKLGAIALLNFQLPDGLEKGELGPKPEFVIVFGQDKIAALLVGLVTAGSQSQLHVLVDLEVDPALVFVVVEVAVKFQRTQLCFPKHAELVSMVVFEIEDVPTTQVKGLGCQRIGRYPKEKDTIGKANNAAFYAPSSCVDWVTDHHVVLFAIFGYLCLMVVVVVGLLLTDSGKKKKRMTKRWRINPAQKLKRSSVGSIFHCT